VIKSISLSPDIQQPWVSASLRKTQDTWLSQEVEWLFSQVISYKDEDCQALRFLLTPPFSWSFFVISTLFFVNVGILLRYFPVLTHYSIIFFLHTAWLWGCSFKVEMEEVGKVAFIQVKACYESISHVFVASLIPKGTEVVQDYFILVL